MAVGGASNEGSICIYTKNVSDGIGDTGAVIRVAQELFKFKDQQPLPLTGIINITTGSPLKGILNLIDSQKDLFEKIYLLCDDPNIYQLKWPDNVEILPKDTKSTSENFANTLQSAKLYIDVYNNNMHKYCGGEFKNLNPDCKKIRLTELGVKPQKLGEDVYRLGRLITNDNGIWFNDNPDESIDKRAERLLAFHQNDYVQMLLNSTNPTQEDAIRYLNDHRFMPGYTQSKHQALFFILSHVLKHCDDSGVLTAHCDFHIPAHTIDRELILKALETCHIQANIDFISQGSTTDDNHPTEKSIRIISGYFLDDHDYNSLFLISRDGAACSGDNSFLQVMSSYHPIFITGCIQNQFIEFATSIFCDSIRSYFPEYAQIFKRAALLNGMDPARKPQSTEFDTICDLSLEIAKTMKEPDFLNTWLEFRNDLYVNTNFSKVFPSIIHKALELTPQRSRMKL